mgnify:CR=1 FL=1
MRILIEFGHHHRLGQTVGDLPRVPLLIAAGVIALVLHWRTVRGRGQSRVALARLVREGLVLLAIARGQAEGSGGPAASSSNSSRSR